MVLMMKNLQMCFLDFKKAFDRVPLKRLLYKLNFYGIRNFCLKWFESYLLNREFMVRLCDCISVPFKITSVMPQGSILDPILFLIYVADLPISIDKAVSLCMYADDTKICKKINNNFDVKSLQSGLDGIMEWSRL